MSVGKQRAWDLEDRLVRLGAAASKIAGGLPSSRVGTHISSQLMRCGMAPAPNYAEACTSESRRDFIHKLKICLKELRETLVWLKYLRELGMGPREKLDQTIQEADELTAIFVVSIATARKNDQKPTKK
ncbi:MAG: four helix bundle protein [Gemmatimonadetes bacterium]|uniref:Four helix bundle protein n=1 Tax=Candidatus Kutchimonas denitrificans TaxID=3056748 RepID=A0AAE5CCE9_9BACT|nr:four helix bundle protein [Gemmatimonadota bacterium]NIR75570.1 four helix bundle protein [Candidatus Kutchimonas denitrificans]NIS01884.1 four helix bundle protein [Gemmatimonadota bacterium]NIT67665.1 four helix bundle protein [Gemmatimonadota bacterium]NIU53539.1 four helix bundle protein [Gemmatimonadota bacterium]